MAIRNFDPNIDYYEILQVHPSAHQEIIKRAFRTIMSMLQGHPDLGGNHEAAVRLNEAYSVLSHDETRKAYDVARERLHAGPYTSSTTTKASRTARAATATAPPPRSQRTKRTHTASPNEFKEVYCPDCGARNRLRREIELSRAVCGKCHAALQPKPPPVTDLPPSRDIKLQRQLDRELALHGEVRLHPVRIPAGRQLRCLRCRHEWHARDVQEMPSECPRCHSRRWSDFRLFLCRYCRHRFVSHALLELPRTPFLLWPWPYWLFPTCPSCGKHHWHHDCERHLLRRLLNVFAGMMIWR